MCFSYSENVGISRVSYHQQLTYKLEDSTFLVDQMKEKPSILHRQLSPGPPIWKYGSRLSGNARQPDPKELYMKKK